MLKSSTVCVYVYHSLLSHTTMLFLGISAIFQSDAINDILGLLKLTIQTKNFPVQMLIKVNNKCCIFRKYVPCKFRGKKLCHSDLPTVYTPKFFSKVELSSNFKIKFSS